MERLTNGDALYEEIAGWTRQHAKAEVMRRLGEAGVPCSANFDTQDLFADPHLRERGFIHTLDHPEHGEVPLLGFAPRMSASEVPMQRAPLLGEHSDEVLEQELALPASECQRLREAGVIG
jgi:formyl-CoA transferase